MSRSSASVVQSAYQSLQAHGFGCFPAASFRELIGAEAVRQLPEVLQSFSRLTADRHMGDGGSYRLRAYNRYRLAEAGDPELLEDHSIFQETADNPVNGGVRRTFAPLEKGIADGPLVQALIRSAVLHSRHCEPSLRQRALLVGVHQVRIVARPAVPGLPTPEGIHRDRERFTFQHFMGRQNIEGGEFRAHDESKRVVFSWLQQDPLDTVMFEGSTWHSATPITCSATVGEGFRDIFLVDVDQA